MLGYRDPQEQGSVHSIERPLRFSSHHSRRSRPGRFLTQDRCIKLRLLGDRLTAGPPAIRPIQLPLWSSPQWRSERKQRELKNSFVQLLDHSRYSTFLRCERMKTRAVITDCHHSRSGPQSASQMRSSQQSFPRRPSASIRRTRSERRPGPRSLPATRQLL